MIKKNLYRAGLGIVLLAWAYTMGGPLAMLAVFLAAAALFGAYSYRRRRLANETALDVDAPAAAAEIVVAYALGARDITAILRGGQILTTITTPPEYTEADDDYTSALAVLARDVYAYEAKLGGDPDASHKANIHLGRLVRRGQAPTGHTLPAGDQVAAAAALRKEAVAFVKGVLEDAAPIHDELTAVLRRDHAVDGTVLDQISKRNPLEDAPSIGAHNA